MNLCQTLGYHRLTSMESDLLSVQQQKQLLFWSVYTILNLMSLRLGRASPIQNYDISLPMLDGHYGVPEPWGPVCIWWTKSSIVQGKVYQYLYSPEALQKPQSERVTHAYKLAAQMQSEVMEPFEVGKPALPPKIEFSANLLTRICRNSYHRIPESTKSIVCTSGLTRLVDCLS